MTLYLKCLAFFDILQYNQMPQTTNELKRCRLKPVTLHRIGHLTTALMEHRFFHINTMGSIRFKQCFPSSPSSFPVSIKYKQSLRSKNIS